MRLISYTKAVDDLHLHTCDELIAYCARVSNPQNQQLNEQVDRLIKYLIKHKHWSPLEMVDVTFELEPTRDIGRQLLRHRSFVFQEFSQRYASVSELKDMFEISECRLQDLESRQNSLENLDAELGNWWFDVQQRSIDFAIENYQLALEKGIAKELARKLLPEGLTKTRMYMKGSIRNWIHLLEVRTSWETQKECRSIAQQIGAILKEIFPLAESFIHKA